MPRFSNRGDMISSHRPASGDGSWNSSMLGELPCYPKSLQVLVLHALRDIACPHIQINICGPLTGGRKGIAAQGLISVNSFQTPTTYSNRCHPKLGSCAVTCAFQGVLHSHGPASPNEDLPRQECLEDIQTRPPHTPHGHISRKGPPSRSSLT
ncbi:hypothetical protein L226DRAFT_125471 [Lentinus tigrinus ALCF2SS1-7]|uniref:uncharacterized protein n=1 Tax=Lentinus tigrinus ALCF2SS1-7 TaxID=1328758 RepID=UPI0011663C45|nr:hypothetical protein L226DRAFT_125471 [Lentinus tigrinus ALCF2SS1-7]